MWISESTKHKIFMLIFICLVARVVIAWRSPRHRRVLPAPAAEDEGQDVAALRRARRAADRRAAEAEAAADAEAHRSVVAPPGEALGPRVRMLHYAEAVR